MGCEMDDRLRIVMSTLRHLAIVGAVNRLPSAEICINEYLKSQHGAPKSVLESLRDAICAEPKEQPVESEFWSSMEEYISTLTP